MHELFNHTQNDQLINLRYHSFILQKCASCKTVKYVFGEHRLTQFQYYPYM